MGIPHPDVFEVHPPAFLCRPATACSQPAVMVSSLAALEELKAEQPDMMAGIGHVAGFSLGEITALVVVGALSFEDGLKVVKVRAEAMQKSCFQSR